MHEQATTATPTRRTGKAAAKNTQRSTALWAAGGLTTLIAITVLALGLGVQDLAFAANTTAEVAAVPTTIVDPAAAVTTLTETRPTDSGLTDSGLTDSGLTDSGPTSTAAATDAVDGLLSQNAQLRQSLEVMLQREAAYQEQLTQAAQTIQTLQTQPAAPAWGGEDEDEEYEHGEREHEEREHEEREHEEREDEEREHDDD